MAASQPLVILLLIALFFVVVIWGLLVAALIRIILPLLVLLQNLLAVGHGIHLSINLQNKKSSEFQAVPETDARYTRNQSEAEVRTLSGGLLSLKGATLLPPLGLSLLPVMLFSHPATVLAETSSG